MSVTLALSAYPGDAVFSVGALLSSLPDEKHHVTVFGAEVDEGGALQLLGATHAALGASAKTLRDALVTLVRERQPVNVLLPLGLEERPGDAALANALPALREAAPAARFLHYHPLPFVNQHRARYPELAFARPIRGIIEADADAATLQWKPRGTASAAPLTAKRAAAAALADVLLDRVAPGGNPPPPTDPSELEALLHRALGTREWVQLA